MAFKSKTPSLPTRVYSYGCRIEDSSKEAVFNQLFKLNRYKNKMIEIERLRRERTTDVIKTLSPDLAKGVSDEVSLEQKCEEIVEQIKQHRIKTRSKTASKDLSDSLKEVKKSLAETRKNIKELKKSIFESDEFKSAIKSTEDKNESERKDARAKCELYWGTYLVAEADFSKIRSGAPPKFIRYEGCGNLAVQIQKGARVDDIEYGGKHTLVQIDTKPNQHGHRNPWRKARFRIGSDDTGKPVWAELTFKMHRPIPKDCVFKWVKLHANRVGTHTEWSLQFTLSQAEWHDKHLPGEGNVAVDVGWRVVPEGLRVAYWVGYDGQEGQLIIPKDRIGRANKVRDLSSIQDKKFDAIKDVLIDWKKKNSIPEWLVEKLSYLHAMKSQGKLARIIIEWRDKRFAGDSGIFEILENWRKGDKHLLDWEGHQRTGEQNWRKNLYRNFSSMLSRKYRKVIIEEVDWSTFHRDVPMEETDPGYVLNKFYHRLAAVSILNGCLKSSMAEFVEADPRATTQECSKCHTNNDFDAAKELVHTCCNCGETWDQDRNACLNLLARG